MHREERKALLAKLAGRIKIEQYSREVNHIVSLIEQFLASKKYLNMGTGAQKFLGTVPFNINGSVHNLNIYVSNSKNGSNGSFQAISFSSDTPYLTINLYELIDVINIRAKLKPTVEHELTHFIDSVYDPILQKTFEGAGDNGRKLPAFYKDILWTVSREDQTNWFSPSIGKQDIVNLAKIRAIKFLKTNQFKLLAKTYNIQMTNDVIGKVINIVRSFYLSKMYEMMDGNGGMLGGEQTPKQIAGKDIGKRLYYNSNMEIAAYINEIISEINEYLETQKEYIGNNKLKISKELVEYLLKESDTFRLVKERMTPENIKKIYREVGIYLIKLEQ